MFPVNCFKCEKELQDVQGYEDKSSTRNHPCDALSFHTKGHYGTTVFDPMDGSSLEINICDDCIKLGTKKGLVVFNEAQTLTRTIPSIWKCE